MHRCPVRAEPVKWQLAPAYDITHAYNPQSAWVNQHLMSVNGKFANITLQDIEVVADRYEMRKLVKPIIAKAKAALARWPHYATEAGVGQQETASIAQDIAQCASGSDSL
ncbi:MAG: hypothetical protein QM533_08685 [Cytophagales bacterium]|nr:hypothetical protein [Cytophagales bacterium]